MPLLFLAFNQALRAWGTREVRLYLRWVAAILQSDTPRGNRVLREMNQQMNPPAEVEMAAGTVPPKASLPPPLPQQPKGDER